MIWASERWDMPYVIWHLTHEDKTKQVGDFEAKEIQYYYEILYSEGTLHTYVSTLSCRIKNSN